MQSRKTTARPTSPKRRLGFGWLIAAAVFLFNPCINIVDLLPDFFGYVFLLKGLEKWADLCPSMREATVSFARLRYIMLAKLVCVLLIPLVDPTFDLLLTFSFAVLELTYVISAFARMFDGFEYFGTRFDGKHIFTDLKSVRLLTSIFFILKSFFCVLPELCSLSSFEYSGYVTSGVQIDFADYKGFLVILNLLLGGILGLMWLVSMFSYLKRISKQTPFLVRVLHDYELEIGQNTGYAIRRNLRTALSLIIAGTVFLPNIWIDGVNVIPTFVGAIFFFCAMLVLRRMEKIPTVSIIMPAVFAIISAVSYVLSFLFGYYHNIKNVYAYPQTYTAFNNACIAAVFEYAVMAAVIVIIFLELKQISKTHLPASPDINDSRLIDIYDQHKRESDRKIVAWLVLQMIALASNIGFILLRANVIADFWLVPFIFTAAAIAYTAGVLNHLYDRIEYKYM